MISGHKVICIEEHYADAEVDACYPASERIHVPALVDRLGDFADMRLREMDEAGIDMQVVSQNAPGLQMVDPAVAVDLAQRANDRLAAVVKTNPTRFAAFASLPTTDPAAAAKELERTVTTFGFKGAIINGLTHGAFLDEPRFDVLLERANELEVPLYLHPSWPLAKVAELYFGPYMERYPLTLRGVWGFNIETATQALRLVLSGILDRYPKLQFLVGHLGETLPYLFWRLDETLALEQKAAPNATLVKSVRDCFRSHFHFTTSGQFSTSAFNCCLEEMGIDRVMFSVDYPFMNNLKGSQWAQSLPLSVQDREKLMGGNAARLLKL
ncbi:MAG TPA: amidohydrolase family protein [Allosphingosinicella sp.]|nr:amidohydrolase family protein [Allosphingosinicella sp.]